MDTKKAFSLISSYGFFLFGFTSIILGSALPAIEKSFGLDHQMAGVLLSLPTLAFMASAIVVSSLSNRFGPFKLLAAGIVCIAAGLTVLSVGRSFWLLLVGSMTVSFGTGSMETSIGIAVSGLNYKKPGGALNLMHSFFAIGSIISPLIVAAFLVDYTSWWKPFLIALFVSLLLLSFIPFLYGIPFVGSDEKATHFRKEIFSRKIFWLIMVGVLLYVGYEIGFTSWLSSFMFESKGIEMRYASIFPALLWAGIFVGRLLAGFFVDKLGYELSLLMMVIIAFVSFGAALLLQSAIAIALAVVFAGFGFSGTFPTLQAILISSMKNGIGFAIGMFTVAASIGGAMSNFLVGLLGHHFGMMAGVIFILFLIFLEMVVVLLIMRVRKERLDAQ
ncbi:MFS transporter [Mesotoga prima]|uniref:MFS transporter n=1 Tax=Mesotoga prima TaxID=1184387 RepID=UPI002BDDADBA|nr:MFS transporter [Mesotoga prima]HOP37695.1 MFS transporter [Mesotoga prima]HPJ32654.1 MFS transporter [Mesotoga prima]